MFRGGSSTNVSLSLVDFVLRDEAALLFLDILISADTGGFSDFIGDKAENIKN